MRPYRRRAPLVIGLLAGLGLTVTGLSTPAEAAAHEVTTPIDVVDPADGEISLREAVALANEGDRIIFADTVRGTIDLFATLSISSDLEIVGPGSDELLISGGTPGSGLPTISIGASTDVSISGIGVTNIGGFDAIRAGGRRTTDVESLRLDDVTLTDSTFVVYATDAVTISDSHFQGMRSEIRSANGASLDESDAMTVDITGTSFVGGFGLEINVVGDVMIDSVNAEANFSNGIGLEVAGDAVITNSVISNNARSGLAFGESNRFGGPERRGTYVVRETQIVDNPQFGILVEFTDQPLEVDRTLLSGNGNGFDISTDAPVQISDSHIADSQLNGVRARRGSGPVDIVRSTISSSEYSALRLDASGRSAGRITRVTNSTFEGNGIENAPIIDVRDGAVRLRHSTVVGNGSAGQSSAVIVGNGATIFGVGVEVDHSVVTANGDRPLFDGDVHFTHSVVPASSGVDDAGNLRTDHPGLGPLIHNGGFAPTMIPLPASRLINAGDIESADAPATDQRGELRIAGRAIDIGAVELQALSQYDRLRRAVRLSLES